MLIWIPLVSVVLVVLGMASCWGAYYVRRNKNRFPKHEKWVILLFVAWTFSTLILAATAAVLVWYGSHTASLAAGSGATLLVLFAAFRALMEELGAPIVWGGLGIFAALLVLVSVVFHLDPHRGENARLQAAYEALLSHNCRLIGVVDVAEENRLYQIELDGKRYPAYDVSSYFGK